MPPSFSWGTRMTNGSGRAISRLTTEGYAAFAADSNAVSRSADCFERAGRVFGSGKMAAASGRSRYAWRMRSIG